MSEARPNLVILAGPNGAGKSTAAPELLQGALGVNEFVNADVIARGLSAFDPDSAAIGAGRVMLSRVRELAEQRVSFAFETTLASRTFRNFFRLYEPLASTWRRCTNASGPKPKLVAERLESQPRRVYDEGVWAVVERQGGA